MLADNIFIVCVSYITIVVAAVTAVTAVGCNAACITEAHALSALDLQ